jgi:hypothetical protein
MSQVFSRGALVPGWWVKVAITIHWYEAILATLAIIVWHFYGVIFDPDVYPMNWAWYDGKVPIEHYAQEHPLDLLTIEKEGGSDHEARSVEAEAESKPETREKM